MVDYLESEFDKIRLRAFKRRLAGHPLYDFWLEILTDKTRWEKMFASDGLAPTQMVSLVFQWAMINGYFEMVKFLWGKVTDAQREYIGMLQWRKVCFKAKAGEVMKFLCGELCQVNAVGLARITWNTFYTALHFTLHEPTPSERSDNMRKLEFLLANCCPTLRAAMLAAENYRGLTDAFLYKDNETFNLFLEHLNVKQLRHARELVDRVIDRKPSDELKWFRQLLMRRQVTIE
uniref:Uncharacterized protein n=1 Tax=Plectus sambesii TaxID=2011161 RepID=A0A914USN4_9BILA